MVELLHSVYDVIVERRGGEDTSNLVNELARRVPYIAIAAGVLGGFWDVVAGLVTTATGLAVADRIRRELQGRRSPREAAKVVVKLSEGTGLRLPREDEERIAGFLAELVKRLDLKGVRGEVLALFSIAVETWMRIENLERRVDSLEEAVGAPVDVVDSGEGLARVLGVPAHVTRGGIVGSRRRGELVERVAGDVKRGAKVVITGPPGVGKTVTAYSAALTLVREGFKAVVAPGARFNPAAVPRGAFVLVPELAGKTWGAVLAGHGVGVLATAESSVLQEAGLPPGARWVKWGEYLGLAPEALAGGVVVVELDSSLYSNGDLVEIGISAYLEAGGTDPKGARGAIRLLLDRVEKTPLCAAVVGEELARGRLAGGVAWRVVERDCADLVRGMLKARLKAGAWGEVAGVALLAKAKRHSLSRPVLQALAERVTPRAEGVGGLLEERPGGVVSLRHPIWARAVAGVDDARVAAWVRRALAELGPALAEAVEAVEPPRRAYVAYVTLSNYPWLLDDLTWARGLRGEARLALAEAAARLGHKNAVFELVAGARCARIDPVREPSIWLLAYGSRPHRAERLLEAAEALYTLGRVDEALERAREAARIAAERGDDALRARSLVSLGRLLQSVNRPLEAARALMEAFEAAARLKGPAGAGLRFEALMYRGRALHAAGRYAEALASYDEALEEYRRGGLSEPASLAWLLVYRGSALLWLNRPRDAVEALEEAAGLLEELAARGAPVHAPGTTTGGGADPEARLGVAEVNLALAYAAMGDYRGALRLLDRAASRLRGVVESGGFEHRPKLTLALFYRAYVALRAWGEGVDTGGYTLDQAVGDAEEAVEMYVSMTDEGRRDQLQGYARALTIAGLALKEAGLERKARHRLRKALAQVEELVGKGVYWMLELGLLSAHALGDAERACWYYNVAERERVPLEFFVDPDTLGWAREECLQRLADDYEYVALGPL